MLVPATVRYSSEGINLIREDATSRSAREFRSPNDDVHHQTNLVQGPHFGVEPWLRILRGRSRHPQEMDLANPSLQGGAGDLRFPTKVVNAAASCAARR